MSELIIEEKRASASGLPDNFPVKTITNVSDFNRLQQAATEAVLWQRKLPASVQIWLNKLAYDDLPEGRFVLRPQDVSECLARLFKEGRHGGSDALAWLCEDAHRLAKTMQNIDGAEHVRMRVERIADNACRKFHIDNVTARLICTYSGPGTQVSLDDAPLQSDKIFTLPTGMPVLFKGKQWPGASQLSLKHRSPPIEGTGLYRSVLVFEGVKSQADIMAPYDSIYSSN